MKIKKKKKMRRKEIEIEIERGGKGDGGGRAAWVGNVVMGQWDTAMSGDTTKYRVPMSGTSPPPNLQPLLSRHILTQPHKRIPSLPSCP